MAQDGQSQTTGPSSSSLAEKVADLVQKAAGNPKDSALFGQLIPCALQYVKSTSSSAKKSHIWCSQGGQPELDLHVCMLRVLSFKSGPEIKEWLEFLAKSLYSCSNCYKSYMLAKEELMPR